MELFLRVPRRYYDGEIIYPGGFLEDKIKEDSRNQYVIFTKLYPHDVYQFYFHDHEMSQLFADLVYTFDLVPRGDRGLPRITEEPKRPRELHLSHSFLISILFPDGHKKRHMIINEVWPTYVDLVSRTRRFQCEWFVKNYDYDAVLKHLYSLYLKDKNAKMYTDFRKEIEEKFEGKRDESLYWNFKR